jgi:hypothetical protein
VVVLNFKTVHPKLKTVHQSECRIHPKLPNELQNGPPIRMQANDENE